VIKNGSLFPPHSSVARPVGYAEHQGALAHATQDAMAIAGQTN
jgi:hypothetical protein